MSPGAGRRERWLTLEELCEWLNITERHARKLVARDAIPYRKVGHLLRFAEAEIEEWSRPRSRCAAQPARSLAAAVPAVRRARAVALLPKSLIEPSGPEDKDHGTRQSA